MIDVLLPVTLPSTDSVSTNGTVRRHNVRQTSDSSVWTLSQSRQTANNRSASHSTTLIDLHIPQWTEHTAGFDSTAEMSADESFKSAFSQRRPSVPDDAVTTCPLSFGDTTLTWDTANYGTHLSSGEPMSGNNDIDLLTGTTAGVLDAIHDAETDADEELDDQEKDQPQGFRRWLSTLRRRKRARPNLLTPRTDRWTLDDFDKVPVSNPLLHSGRKTHRKSESCSSSLGVIATMKSATVTLASASIAPLSRRNSKWRHSHHRESITSTNEPRPSAETQPSIHDKATNMRSRKRREKIEELIRTEESYVADLKALSDIYFTLLGHQQSGASFARASSQRTITEILHLHDDLLGELHRIVPFAEYDQNAARFSGPPRRALHARWHSVDAVPQRRTPSRHNLGALHQARRSLNINRSSEEEPMMLRCSPQVVAAVASVFCKYMPRFRIYANYGTEYELVQRDIEETQRMIATWPDFDRAIEALSGTLNPVRSREANRRKALTVKDLLIKPIQRLPRYELLFAELCKMTPPGDDPSAHAFIEDLQGQLGKACQEMNDAQDSPSRTRMLEATWLLGDRLTFSDQVSKAVFFRLLGEILICGCLHICYRSKGDFVRGSYVICVLFSTTLLLASVAQDEPPKYRVLAGLSLANAAIEETDNGKGLQCHTTPHSWKVVFENSGRMYELILTACSATEASVWRSYLTQRIQVQRQAAEERGSNTIQLHSPLIAEMKSVGAAFGKSDSFVRRMSVHRSATVGTMTDLSQVIIKNTQAVKDALENNSSTGSLQMIPRSQSVATPSHVQTLAPRRADRIRLESLLADVWTKDVLPFPGMTIRRSDQLRNHVIRKFSKASITSNFSSSKRNGSFTTLSNLRTGREDAGQQRSFGRSRGDDGENVRPNRLGLADLLPADFDLKDHTAKPKRKNALRALTMTMERPFSPLLGSEHKSAVLQRAQSVRDRHEMATTPEPFRPGMFTAPLNGTSAARGKKETAMPGPSSQRVVDEVAVVCDATQRQPSPAQAEQDVRNNGEATVTVYAKAPKKAKSKHKLLRLFG